MNLKAIIIEQLESDGNLRTLEMEPMPNRKLLVGFAHEFSEPRDGPFHFLNSEDEQRFGDGFAQCRAMHLGSDHFVLGEGTFHVKIPWQGIPTERNCLSYYALSLPQYGVPLQLSITDPHFPGREYRRLVRRDDDRHRYVIYLECTSSHGRFDFDLECEFAINESSFGKSHFHDPKASLARHHIDAWKNSVDMPEIVRVQQFFIEGDRMGDQYFANQVGAMGPNASVIDSTFSNTLQLDCNVDLHALAGELDILREQMQKMASEPAHKVAADEIAAAQKAANEGNGGKAIEHLRKAGGWALDVSNKIGIGLATAALKSALGI